MNSLFFKSIVLVISLFGSSALASKARVLSMQGANHLVDTQTIFTNPSHINLVKNQLIFEMGDPGISAEGGLIKTTLAGDKLLVYLGHLNNTETTATGDMRTGNSFLGQNNPVEVIWGKGTNGYGVSLSTVNNDKTGSKETTVIVKGGSTEANQSTYGHLHLISSADKTSGGSKDKILASPYIVVGGSVNKEYRLFGSVAYGKADAEPGGGKSISLNDTAITIGAEDQSLKTTLADIYYGAKIQIANRDIDGKKVSRTDLPVFMGFEYAFATASTFRASVSQNLFLGSVKDETASNTKADGIASNTTVDAGFGVNINNLQFDVSLTADASPSSSDFLGNMSVTYYY